MGGDFPSRIKGGSDEPPFNFYPSSFFVQISSPSVLRSKSLHYGIPYFKKLYKKFIRQLDSESSGTYYPRLFINPFELKKLNSFEFQRLILRLR